MKSKIFKTTILQFIGIIMAQCLVFSYNPIGIAYFAAAYALCSYRWITFPVMLISMATAMSVLELSKYAMVMLIVIACYGIYEMKKKNVSQLFLSLVTGVSIFVIELSDSLMMPMDLNAFAIDIFIGILTSALTFVFCKAIESIQNIKKSSQIKNEEMISLAIVIGLVIYYISGLGILPSGIFEMVAYFAVLFSGYRYGAGMGAIIGSSCGIVFSITQQNLGVLGIMCTLGILVGTFRELGKLGSIIAFSCGVIGASYLFDGMGMDIGQVRGLVSACLVFLLLPRRVVYMQEKKENETSRPFNDSLNQNSQLNSIAESFTKLSNTLSSLPTKKADLSKMDLDNVFEEVSSSFCKSCDNCNFCWEENAFETFEETKLLLKAAENGNAICVEDIPTSFRKKCKRSKAFISEINHLFERARLNLIWYNRIVESREAVADQLKEVAMIIEDYSKNIYNFVALDAHKEEHIRQKLKAHRIIMKKIVMLERKNHIIEVVITAKTEKGECVTTRELVNILGNIIGKNIIPMKDCKKLVGNEYSTFNLIEDTNFFVMHGTARKTKNEGEEISGDNFAILDFGYGQMLASLADGMGTGIYAYKDSETVIELLEQLLDSGFSEDVSLKLINSVMLLNSDTQNPTTLDMSIIDLYSGVCDFIKLGAASTFIKRGNWVEAIKSTTLPVGVMSQIDIESVSKKMYNGDFIIMVSDGITDALIGEDKEKELSKIIMGIDSNNPNEVANQILEKTIENSSGEHEDDMTILVIGLWEKCA